MSCCDPYGPYHEDTVGTCPDCGGNTDKEGDSTEESCGYSPPMCRTCKWSPCDQSC